MAITCIQGLLATLVRIYIMSAFLKEITDIYHLIQRLRQTRTSASLIISVKTFQSPSKGSFSDGTCRRSQWYQHGFDHCSVCWTREKQHRESRSDPPREDLAWCQFRFCFRWAVHSKRMAESYLFHPDDKGRSIGCRRCYQKPFLYVLQRARQEEIYVLGFNISCLYDDTSKLFSDYSSIGEFWFLLTRISQTKRSKQSQWPVPRRTTFCHVINFV